jgi:hypothetical protein
MLLVIFSFGKRHGNCGIFQGLAGNIHEVQRFFCETRAVGLGMFSSPGHDIEDGISNLNAIGGKDECLNGDLHARQNMRDPARQKTNVKQVASPLIEG